MSDIRKLAEFYSEFSSHGIRTSNQFQITVSPISEKLGDSNRFTFYAKSSTVPGRTLEQFETQFMGMTFRIPNNLTFDGTWSVSVLCDHDMEIRKICEDMYKEFADLSKGGGGKKMIPTYKARVDLLDMNLEKIVETYNLVGIFINTLGELTLDHSSNDGITFDCGFIYQYVYRESEGDPLGVASK